jgi:hypothetical protein
LRVFSLVEHVEDIDVLTVFEVVAVYDKKVVPSSNAKKL